MKKTAVITGGGTGGHIYPGIAIARAVQELDPDYEVHFVGSSQGLESKIVPREGLPLHLLPIGKLNYSGGFGTKILTLLKMPLAFLKALYILYSVKPRFILGVGGYASGPFVLLGRLFGFKTAIWEPNAFPGLTNRWLSPFVSTAYIVFEEAASVLSSPKKVQVGLPVRNELEKVLPKEAEEERADLDFHVLCFGGSQGARGINLVFKESILKENEWLNKSRLIHQTGVSDYGTIKAAYKKSVFNLEAYEYLFDMPKYYRWADVVVCRAGASTVAELAAQGKPAILVPLESSADNHQLKNAQAVANCGGGILIEQKDFTPERLNSVLMDLQQNPEKLKEMSLNIKRLYKPQAAQVIAKDLIF